MKDIGMVTYLTVYIIIVIYFVIPGCTILTRRYNLTATHGEIETKRRLTKTVGIGIFAWAFSYFIYLPPLMYGCDPEDQIYRYTSLFH